MIVSYTDVSKKREVWKELSAQISGKFKIILSNSNSHEALYLNYNYSNIDIELT